MTDSFDPARLLTAIAMRDLRETYDDLDTWRARPSKLEVPQPGSDLSRDTAATKDLGAPLHEIARHPLVSATQHLDLARTSIEAGQFFPIAHPTTLRGALLSAARGVWLLHSDEPSTRRLRAARVAVETNKRLLQWIEEPANGLDDEMREDAYRVISALIQAHAARPEVKKLAYTETNVINEAGRYVFNEPHEQMKVIALWRQLSGDAHGLPWPILTKTNTISTPLGRHPDYAQPMTQVSSGGDLRETVDAFWCAYRILKRGWSLFDQRCTAP